MCVCVLPNHATTSDKTNVKLKCCIQIEYVVVTSAFFIPKSVLMAAILVLRLHVTVYNMLAKIS